MTVIDLVGLRTRPMSTYLAALGVFRIVCAQADEDARASWSGRHLQLHSELGVEELTDFLASRYQPTPLVAPWNGKDQGGFRPGAKTRSTDLVSWIRGGDASRLRAYREVVVATDRVVATPGWQQLNESTDKRDKVESIRILHNSLPDVALPFMDAAVALTADGIGYPPIFGTGGNVGRLDLVVNFIEHLKRIFEPGRGEHPGAWLEEVLFDRPAVGVRSTPGQFDYAGVGGANLGRAGAAPERVNPWTFVLAVEGALSFAASATRRMGSERSQTAALFTVRASPSGFASASAAEGAKGELWLPTWKHPWSWRELEAFLGEGRASWGAGQARTGTDLLRSVRTLGTERGVDEFERYLFLERNGQSPAAVPVGSIQVTERVSELVHLTRDLDRWVQRLNQGADDRVSAPVRSARRRVNRALYDLAERPDRERLRSLLLAVAHAERAVQRSSQFRALSGIGPAPALSGTWVDELRTDEPEFAIARLLTNGHDRWDRGTAADRPPRSLRELIRPIEVDGRGTITQFSRRRVAVEGLGSRSVVDVLADVAVERARSAPQVPDREEPPFRGVRPQFAVWSNADSAIDPRAGRALAESLACGGLDEVRLGEWLEVLVLTAPLGLMAAEAHPTALRPSVPAPIWRLFAPWFGQRTLVSRGRMADGDGLATGWRLVPVVRRTWPGRLRAATGTDLSGIVREVRSGYAAAGTLPGFDPTSLGTGLDRALMADARAAVRALAALMVPIQSVDLVQLADDHLRIHQGAVQ